MQPTKTNKRGFTLIELLIFLGVLAVVGAWVATQGSNVISGSRTESAIQQIDSIMRAAESYKNTSNQAGSYRNVSLKELTQLGYKLQPLTDGVNQNTYGLSTTITSTDNGNTAQLEYFTLNAPDCEQLRIRLGERALYSQTPQCVGNQLILRFE